MRNALAFAAFAVVAVVMAADALLGLAMGRPSFPID